VGRSGAVDVLGDNDTPRQLFLVSSTSVKRQVRIVTMHAIEVTETGGPEVLKYVDKPRPSPRPGEVLIIKAEAIGVNFVDTYFRSGSYPHKRPFVLGAEVGGTVEALGDGVTALRVGDRVATADAVGAYAEYCVAPANVVASLPDGVSPDVAAAAILKGMTAHR
jgi:NADPH:quinone reductase